jgi:hypothetical protein
MQISEEKNLNYVISFILMLQGCTEENVRWKKVQNDCYKTCLIALNNEKTFGSRIQELKL